jgi:acyl-CoA synthetase (AMP-forming)/AMP-acid ligase II
METLKDVILRNVECHPDKTAFIFGDKRYTFKEFNNRVNSLINALMDMGVEKGGRVGVLAYNCPQYFEIYCTAKAGMVGVPLNYRFVGRELAYLINNSEANTVIVEREFLDVMRSIRPEIKGVKNFICLDEPQPDMMYYEELLSKYPPDEPTVEVDEEDLMVLFYTSGTTGVPKGAMHTHKSLITNARITAPLFHLTPDDIVLCVMPFFHVGGSVFYLFPSFYTGCTTAMLSKFDAKLTLETIERERVTNVHPVPTMIVTMLEYPDFHKYDISSLRTILYAASPMPVAALKKGIKLFGENIFLQAFGQSESGAITILKKEDHKVEGSEEELKVLLSAGKPFPGIEVRIADDQDNEAPPGEVGEIIVRSEVIMKGYWKMPEETAETLRGGWLHTGDMGRWDENGYLYIVDRKKDMIISGAENIYPREVEEVLYAHPAVLEAAVVGVPDEKWGESVKAVLALKQGMMATEEEIIEHCKQRLASYKKPKSVEFWDSLPKNPAGKIMKKEIRERYWKGREKRV